MKWLMLAAASLVVGTCVRPDPNPLDLDFQEWKIKFKKTYTSNKEETMHKKLWMTTYKMVLEHNMLADQGKRTFRMGMNQFSDMGDTEYHQTLHSHLDLSKITENSTRRFAMTKKKCDQRKKMLKYKDWREMNCVTPVKNQGQCASCWAFSAVGALESHTCIKKRYLPTLSEQQLMDCSGDTGCKGRPVEEAFKYSKKIEGNINEEYYMYEAKNSKCRFNEKIPKNIIGARCRKYKKLKNGDECELQKVVAQIGPVSVSVDASKASFKNYASGVYYEPDCGSNINHAMLVVGYGTNEQGVDYWIVKNSYGTAWGEQGYIKMARNKNNNCAIASYPIYPVV